MGLVLDSSILIAAGRKRFDLPGFLEAEAAMTSIFVSAITVSELLHGVERASTPEIRQKRLGFVQAIIDDIPTLDFSIHEARHHAKLWADLARKGTLIGPHDMMIAATALAANHQLATLNRAEFQRVEGLRLPDISRFQLT